MDFFENLPHVNFMSRRKPFMALSAVLVLLSLASVLGGMLKFGIDFTGGTVVELLYPQPADLGGIRNALAGSDFKDALVQNFGSTRDVLIRMVPKKGMTSSQISSQILDLLKGVGGGKPQLKRVDFVGPQVGSELKENGGLALIFALIGILIYVAARFEMRLAFGAVVATVHDTVITLGLFTLTGMDFDLVTLAGVLAVIGYSVNDTVVVYDRIRENFIKMRKGTPEEIVNLVMNQTLSRTLMTSGATLLSVIALYLFGGKVIHGFSFVLLVGILVGTYSSIYVASAMALTLGFSRADLLPVKKEGAEIDGRP